MNITKEEKITYLSLGDYLEKGTGPYNVVTTGYSNNIRKYIEQNDKLKLHISEFINEDYYISDLINQVKDNDKKQIKDKRMTIQHALVKADITTISIGNNDINNFLILENTSQNQSYFYKKIDKMLEEYEELFSLLRIYCKEKIYLVGVYNKYPNNVGYVKLYNSMYEYLNNELIDLTKEYDIEYINVYEELLKEKYFPNPKSMYPSDEAYNLISRKIIDNFYK